MILAASWLTTEKSLGSVVFKQKSSCQGPCLRIKISMEHSWKQMKTLESSYFYEQLLPLQKKNSHAFFSLFVQHSKILMMVKNDWIETTHHAWAPFFISLFHSKACYSMGVPLVQGNMGHAQLS